MSLIRAIDSSETDEILRILDTMPEEIDVRDDDQRSALHYAAEMCDVETFTRIFDADPTLLDSTDKNGYTPLLNAIMVGRIDVAEFLAQRGANVHHSDNDGHNLVHWATVCGQLAGLQWALDKNVAVNARDKSQEATPIHYSTVSDEIGVELEQAVIVKLLRNGGDANARDKDHRTPILWCASNGNVEAMKVLQNSGGDIMAKDKDNLGVLHCAASHGYHEVIEYYMSRVSREKVDDQDRAGHTALFYAVTFGHYESALKLLQNGANPNHQDQRLRTPCHCAASKGQMRMLKLLKHYNASFDISNYRGDLPFHEAVQSGSKDVVEWILSRDDSVLDTPNHNGRTAMHLAAAAGNLELIILFCSKNCYIQPLMTIKNDVYTPLDLAVEQKHADVVDYLRNVHGAKSRDDFTPEAIREWRDSFEATVRKAKQERDRMIEQLREKRLNNLRRPSTADNVGDSKEIADVGVNTTTRSTKSADESRLKRKVSKSTSVTSLENGGEKNGDVDEPTKLDVEPLHVDGIDLDDDFEELPPLSDNDDDDEAEKDEHDDDGRQRRKEVKIDETKKLSSSSAKKKKKKAPKKNKIMLRVRREPEIGNDGGDVEFYFDDDEDDGTPSLFGPTANGRYIHEKAIFQELTHLKRMQIQYGKVQEKILVRSLISNFCKMHNLDAKNFKFQTFYAWEKFLYDALSEQLKLIYLEERERLNEAHSEMYTTSKFETRARRSAPYNEKLREMQRIYANSTMSSSNSKMVQLNKSKFKSDGKKRCDCLEKHLLL
ncbi:unnamed protein product [Caenorhabditis bovis]|uniref:ANK_REP_REGION domain-containing protein n=1 Tax=Caenorhabditis bovis TaxID=2654633 RepID=A0A8S1E5K1_9PELO|nr:unnamed protein product [Caenorhabditis bovis]